MPFVVRAPTLPRAASGVMVRREVVELVDVYPTLCDLAGIRCPLRARSPARVSHAAGGAEGSSVRVDAAPPLDGRSLLSLLLSEQVPGLPDQSHSHVDESAGGPTERVAIAAYPRCTALPPRYSMNCNDFAAANISTMGTSARSASLRLVVWSRWESETRRPIFHSLREHLERGEVELYRFDTGTTDAGGEAPRHFNPKDLTAELTNLAATPLLSEKDRAACERLFAAAVSAWLTFEHESPHESPDKSGSEYFCLILGWLASGAILASCVRRAAVCRRTRYPHQRLPSTAAVGEAAGRAAGREAAARAAAWAAAGEAVTRVAAAWAAVRAAVRAAARAVERASPAPSAMARSEAMVQEMCVFPEY